MFRDVLAINHGSQNFWQSANGDPRSTLTFDLGQSYSIAAIVIWNHTFSNGVRNFQLFADNDSNFNNGGNLLGSYSAHVRAGSNIFANIVAQPFFFDPVLTKYVHLNIIDNHYAGFTIPGPQRRSTFISEVAFGRSTIEVPFEYGNIPVAVLIVTVGGINYFRNKKKGRKDDVISN